MRKWKGWAGVGRRKGEVLDIKPAVEHVHLQLRVLVHDPPLARSKETPGRCLALDPPGVGQDVM